MAKKKPQKIIVTRQPAFAEYVKEVGLAPEGVEVTDHATVDSVKGKHVIGLVPVYLAAHAHKLTMIPIITPPELRGAKLTIEQIREYAREPVNYETKIVD